MATQVSFLAPNSYSLTGGGIHVGYSTTGIDGKPHFNYQDAKGSRSFSGSEITVDKTAVGDVVTVVIYKTVDSGSTTFSMLIPAVNLPAPDQPVAIDTDGITTVHRFSIVPGLDRGQMELYCVTPMCGTASHLVF
jgi:hypothetical protein